MVSVIVTVIADPDGVDVTVVAGTVIGLHEVLVVVI